MSHNRFLPIGIHVTLLKLILTDDSSDVIGESYVATDYTFVAIDEALLG